MRQNLIRILLKNLDVVPLKQMDPFKFFKPRSEIVTPIHYFFPHDIQQKDILMPHHALKLSPETGRKITSVILPCGCHKAVRIKQIIFRSHRAVPAISTNFSKASPLAFVNR